MHNAPKPDLLCFVICFRFVHADMDDDPMSHGGMRQKDVNAKDIITDKKFFNAFVDDCDDDKLE
jgi:hypothetical protein